MEKIDFFEQMIAQRRDPSSVDRKHYTNAQWALATGYEWAQSVGEDIMILKEVLWEGFPTEMSELLAKLNVRQICIACPSASLLEYLDEFCKCGWSLKEMRQVPTSRIAGQLYNDPAIVLERSTG